MHLLTQRTIRDAVARGCALDMLMHFDAVSALDKAAHDTDGSGEWEGSDLLDRPRIVGEVEPRLRMSGSPAVLYTPSYAALLWLEDAGAWFAGNRKLSLLAGAWVLAHARDPRTIKAVSRADVARREVKRWGRTLNCGLRELAAAYNEIMQPASATKARTSGKQPAEESRGVRDGKLRRALLRLQAEFGHDDNYWLYGPATALNAALRLLSDQDAAEDRALAKASGKPTAQNPESPSVRAFVRWREAREAFLVAVGVKESNT